MVGITAWVQILDFPSPRSCVASWVTFLPSVPWFPSPIKWGYKEFLPHRVVVRIKWVMHSFKLCLTVVCAPWVFHIAVLTGKKHNLKVENDALFLLLFLAITEGA